MQSTPSLAPSCPRGNLVPYQSEEHQFCGALLTQRTVCGVVALSDKAHIHSQTVRARKLKIGEKVYPTPCVTCQVSHVTFDLFLLFLDKMLELVG